MVQRTEVTTLKDADQLVDRWSLSRGTLILLAFAATMTHCAQAQNIEGQPIAAQYGEFEVQNEGNGFAFDPANCTVTGGGENFPAFTTGTPVKVVDALPAQTEVSTTVNAFLSGSNCAVSLGGLAYQHTSFYLTSGTGGLQEALNNEKIRAGGNNTIILNARWYELVAPRTPSSVISTVSGSNSFGLVDITTNPYTSYNWNGSQYVQAAPSSGSPSGAAGGALSGNYPNPGLSSTPIALPAGRTATTCSPGENDTKVATNACVAAAGGGSGVTPSTQYQIPAFATGGTTVHGINVTTDSTGNNLNIPAGALTLSNPGVFSSTANNFPNLTTVNGCSLTTIFTEVQYTATLTSALSACASGPTNSPGTAYNQTAGLFAAATASGIGSGSGTSRAVGVNGYAIITGNNTEGFGMNPVVQDFNDSATGQQLIGEEIDVQPQKAASAYYNNGFGVLGTHYVLYNQGGQGGTYGPVLDISGSNYGTPAYFGEIADVMPGALCPSGSCPVLNVNAFTDPATSSNNYGSASLAFLYETYWNGSASAHASWRGPQAFIGSGTNPMADSLLWSHNGGPAGQTHAFELGNGIQLQLDGSTSGSAVLSASATGGTLNLGSTNATVSPSGVLSVTGCTGCSSVGTVLQADGFPSAGGTYAGTYNSGATYTQYQTVTSAGADWICLSSCLGVTPAAAAAGSAQLWAPFDSSGAGLAATQADAAFFSSWGQVQAGATGFGADSGVSLVFGNRLGGYNKNGDWVMPNNTFGYSVSLYGQGRGQTWIHQAASTLNYMISSPNVNSSAGQTIQGITLDANILAGGCLSHHLRRSIVSDIACWNPQQQAGGTIASAMWLGQGADSYETLYQHLLVRSPTYSGLVAAYGTATVTSGAITAISWGSTGTNLNLPVTAGPGLVAYFIGKGPTSTSYQPCGTMPVVSSIALTGGSINTSSGVGGITFTSAGATCGGTIYVRVMQAGTMNEAYYLGGSDTTADDIVTSGDFKVACEYVNGPFSLKHEHPYCAAPYLIESAGGGVRVHTAPEMDSPIQYGMYIAGSGATVQGAFTEFNAGNEYGSGDFLIDAAATNFSVNSSGCYFGSVQSFGGYAKFTGTTAGPLTSFSTALPSSASITGVQENCDGSASQWGNFSPPVTTAQTNLYVANVKQYGAVGNGSSHQACTYLGLANLTALQAYNGGQFSFATACTNQMDWLAAQYAVNALTSTGGSIKFSGGPYIWDQPVILPNSQDAYTGSSKGIYLLGDGEGGTLIEPAVADFGANSGMVSCGPPTASYADNSGAGSGRYGGVGACYGGISDITFYNPYSDTYNGGANVNVSSSTYARGITNVPAPGYSGSPIQMDGVLLGGRMNLKRVGAWGFRMGFNLVGDHMTWDQIDAEKDFCGLYWAPASIYLVGDIVLQGHSFVSGNTFAGTCVDKDASIIGFYQGGEYYTGYQPYAFIKFPGISDNYGEAYGGAYTPFFANANYDIIQSEAIGNAVMWDDNLTNSAGGVQTGQASIGGVKINGIYTVFASASGKRSPLAAAVPTPISAPAPSMGSDWGTFMRARITSIPPPGS